MRPATNEEKAQYDRNPYSGLSWAEDELLPDTTQPSDTETAQPDTTQREAP